MTLHAQQHSRELMIGTSVYLQSYDTLVARKDPEGGVTLSEAWETSRTTITHVGRFVGLSATRIRQKIRNGTITVVTDLGGARQRAAETPKLLEEAAFHVDSRHHFHAVECLCGFSSPRSRSRTEHITRALIDEFNKLAAQ